MPYIQVTLTKEEDEILKAASKRERRSKTAQLKESALAHALSIVPEMKLGRAIESPAAIKKSLKTVLLDFLSHGKATDSQFAKAAELNKALKA